MDIVQEGHSLKGCVVSDLLAVPPYLLTGRTQLRRKNQGQRICKPGKNWRKKSQSRVKWINGRFSCQNLDCWNERNLVRRFPKRNRENILSTDTQLALTTSHLTQPTLLLTAVQIDKFGTNSAFKRSRRNSYINYIYFFIYIARAFVRL